MIADLDEHILKCRPGSSKSYAEEALAAYRAGAYRSSIVTTWISVVFDIIEKMREAALFGNAEIKQKLSEFEQWQDQIAMGNTSHLSKALERDILDYAHKKLEFIDAQQLLDLNRLQEDRNRCAHPTFQREGVPYQPTGEIARAHLCHAMLHLLQQPPVQGRAALSELRRIVTSEYFPKEPARAKTELNEHVLARPSPALIRGAIDELLFGFFEDGNSYCHKPPTTVALRAIVEIARDVAEPRLREQFPKIVTRLQDQELMYEIVLVALIPECARALSQTHFDKLDLFIKQAPINNLLPILNRAYRSPQFQKSVSDRIGAQSGEVLASLIKVGIHEPAVDRAVALYCSAGTWDRANYLSQNLMMPLTTHLERKHVELIIQSAASAHSDLVGSFGFKEFIHAIRAEKVIEDGELDEMLKVHDNLSYYLTDTVNVPATVDDDIPF